ncbi:MAG: hypothetical protein AAB459_04600 [Patescibacteria group bacterium]
MFQKLLSNLPFNPSLVDQVAFYAKRLHAESRVRLVAIVLMIIAVIAQLFAVIVPPQPSLALSQNDIIPGGFSTKDQAINHCNKNDHNFKEILGHYGISCELLQDGYVQNIKSTDYHKNLYSMGRLPYGKVGEHAVEIEGKTYYMRYLWSWDSGPYSTYKAIVGKNKDNKTFIVLFNCGNLVVVGKLTPPPPDDECPRITGIQTNKQQCDICENKAGIQLVPMECDVCPRKSGTQLKLEDCDTCPNLPGIQQANNGCLPCPESEDKDDKTSCLELGKKASNLTQNIKNADGTMAKPGDEIRYTLTIKNSGKVSVNKYVVEEPVVDIIEYAEIIDFGGASLTSNNTLRWPSANIGSKKTITKNFVVKIRNSISATPKATSNPGSFDLIMTNVFGSQTVNIKLPAPLIKTTEQVVEQLPKTGPGTSLLICFGVTTIMGYFIARTNLMAKELDFVKRDSLISGGF